MSAGYQFTPALRVYTRIAQGYKPTGYSITPPTSNTATPYDAERSVTYEIGSRYESGPVQLQEAVFHTHTKNMQLLSDDSVGYQTLVNAGSADATGVELSNTWQFTEGWSWNVNGNYVRSEFTSDSERYEGKRVPFVPRFGAGTSITGTIITPFGALMSRVAVNVVGPHYFDGDNTLRQGSYSTTNLRLGLSVSVTLITRWKI